MRGDHDQEIRVAGVMPVWKNAVGVSILALGFLTMPACGKKAPPPPPAAPDVPPPAPPPSGASESAPEMDEYARLRSMSAEEIDRLNLLDEVHFDYDSSDLREDARRILTHNAGVLKRFDFLRVTVEGHCDERGTVEYNLALGERRAGTALEYLVSLGVATDRLLATSYGKEVPVCEESTEACWARNRRARFRVTGTGPD